MTTLSDIFDLTAFGTQVSQGLIRLREHPTIPSYRIANYTEEAAFGRYWTPETLACRGLIYDANTFEVIARPFGKFFNHGEPNARQIDLEDTVKVYDKADGSLGIIYMTPNGFLGVATRGSFQSEQAIWASAWLNRRDDTGPTHNALYDMIEHGLTPLVEIVYPDNRIVLDYEGFEGLISLGSVEIDTGYVHPPFSTPDIRPTEFFGEMTLAEALARPPRKNAEGFVLQAGSFSHDFVKVKQEDYLVLHRLITGLSVKEIWRQMRAGDFDDYVVQLPDEFQEWALDKERDLLDEFSRILGAAHGYFEGVMKAHLEGPRKDQALWIQQNVPGHLRGLVFSMLDGKDVREAIYKMIEPKGTQPLISDEA